jgi:PEP-CTERM motif
MLSRTLALALVAILVAPALAPAAFVMFDPDQPIPLTDTTVIVAGDKEFSNFWVASNLFGGDDPLPLDSINVYPGYDDTTGDLGLFFHTMWGVTSGETLDFYLQFSVRITDDPEYANYGIKDVRMDIPGVGAAGTGDFIAVETVYTAQRPDGEELGRKTFWLTDDQGLTYGGFDWDPPVREIWVYKDILLDAGDNGAVQLSGFYQYFSQIPEPSAMALVSIGGVAALARRRKRA